MSSYELKQGGSLMVWQRVRLGVCLARWSGEGCLEVGLGRQAGDEGVMFGYGSGESDLGAT